MRVSPWCRALLVTTAGLGLAAPAWACALDNRPSMSANGVLAHLTATVPTAATLPTWAAFTFPRTFRPGRVVRFSEDQTDVRRTLTPSALSHPWRWAFGDGSTAIGYNVQHSYRHAGTYKVTVRAYFTATNYHDWLEFDAVTIRVR